MAFLTEPEPPRGVALPVAPGIRRVVAGNAGVMTYHGTNTYLIEEADGLTVLDPGPDEASHVNAILHISSKRIARILISHSHRDHIGAVASLKAASAAPVLAYMPSADPDFTPDIGLGHGDSVGDLQALHTPGHAADHLCFARADGIVFTGDHVMSWRSSVVSPPRGDMAAYFRSLRLLLGHGGLLYLPGHGPPLPEPAGMVTDLLRHRMAREASIAASLGTRPLKASDLVSALYSQTDPVLRAAAERNVTAHLIKLAAEGKVVENGGAWQAI